MFVCGHARCPPFFARSLRRWMAVAFNRHFARGITKAASDAKIQMARRKRHCRTADVINLIVWVSGRLYNAGTRRRITLTENANLLTRKWTISATVCVDLQERSRGEELGGTVGIVPLKQLGVGDGDAFIPHQYLQNVSQIYNVKTNKNERERRWDPCDRDRHTSIILFPYDAV